MDNYKEFTKEDLGNKQYSMTDNLRVTILETVKEKNIALFEHIKEMFAHYVNQFMKNIYEADIHSTTHSFQKYIDGIIEENPGTKDSTCFKQGAGCSFCCYINVDVTREEADILVDQIKTKHISIDTDKLVAQAQSELYSDLEYKDRKCVLLDYAGKCSVYEHRPMMCRKHLVINPVEDCNTEDGIKQTSNMVITKAEVVTSAALNCSKDIGRMSNMLLKSLNDYENTPNDIIPA